MPQVARELALPEFGPGPRCSAPKTGRSVAMAVTALQGSALTADVAAAYAGSRPGVRRFVTPAAQPAVDAWVMIRRRSAGSRSWIAEPLPAFAAAPAAADGSGGGTGSHWTSERLPESRAGSAPVSR
jgi:hypothetical protein